MVSQHPWKAWPTTSAGALRPMIKPKDLPLVFRTRLSLALVETFSALAGLWLGYAVLHLVISRFRFFEQYEVLEKANTFAWASLPDLLSILVKLTSVGPIVTLLTRSKTAGIAALVGIHVVFKPWNLGSENSNYLAFGILLILIALGIGTCIMAESLEVALVARCRLPMRLIDNIHVALILGIGCYFADLFAHIQEGAQSWIGKPLGVNAVFAKVAYTFFGRTAASIVWGDPGFAAALWWWPAAIIAFRFWLRRRHFNVVWYPFAFLLIVWALSVVFVGRWSMLGSGRFDLSLRAAEAVHTIAEALQGPYAAWIDPALTELEPWLAIHLGWLLLFVLAAFWPQRISGVGGRTVLHTTRHS